MYQPIAYLCKTCTRGLEYTSILLRALTLTTAENLASFPGAQQKLEKNLSSPPIFFKHLGTRVQKTKLQKSLT